jgi:hypothetical protein
MIIFFYIPKRGVPGARKGARFLFTGSPFDFFASRRDASL